MLVVYSLGSGSIINANTSSVLSLEGIIFNIYSIGISLRDLAGDIQEIRASGGFARSKEWRQIMADIFGYEVLIPEIYEGSCFGAAVLAMYAVGAIDTLADVQRFIQIVDRHEPDAGHARIYRELFSIHERIYQHVVDDFAALADFQRRSEGQRT